MDKHWSEYLTLSLVHFMAFPETMCGTGPIVETICRAAEDGFFGGLEVGWNHDPALRRQVRATLQSAHLPARFGAQPALLSQKLDLNSSDPEMRARAVDQLKECVNQAAELGLDNLSTVSGIDPGVEKRAEAMGWLADSLHQVCEHGRRSGVSITVETFDRDVDKHALLGPAAEAAEFSALMRQDYADFGIMYDLSHLPLLGEQIRPALTTLQDHLVHAHVGNCVAVPGRESFGDTHPRFGFPGSANDLNELIEFLSALFEIGYLKKDGSGAKPWVGIEVKPQTGETTPQLLTCTKEAWTEAWLRLQVESKSGKG